MKTSVERVDDTTVKLSVTVESARVDAAIDAAARELAQEVRIPGFRPGRAPRRLLESRLGKGTLLQEAVRDALPEFYSEAVDSEELQVVGPPEFDVETFVDGQDAAFTATVEVRPEIAVPDYAGVEVAHPEWEVTDEDMDRQLDALRDRFAEVETVERPVRTGDLAVVTVTASRDGEPVPEASEEDVLYEVGDAAETERALDREIQGASAGAMLRFADAGPDGQPLDYTAIVKEVKVKQLPDVDDDFALTASEFDTIEELRDDLHANLGRQKRAYARQALRGEVVKAVTDLVEVPLPASMVQSEQRFRLERIAQQAQQYGMTLEQYLQVVGESTEELLAQAETEAQATVKAQLVVDAVGRAAGIEISESDLGEEIGRQAVRLGRPPEELAQLMTHPDRIGALISDAFRRRAIDHLVAAVTVTDAPPPEAEDSDEELEYVSDDPDDVEGHDAGAAIAAAGDDAAADDDPEEPPVS